jgi:carboxyl-terminal processing protease
MQILTLRHQAHRTRLLGFFLSALLLASLAACNSSTSSSADPRPPLPGASVGEAGEDGSSPLESADSREPRLSQAIAQLLNSQHLGALEINDELSRKSFDQFLKTLDFGKLFLLQADVDKLSKLRDELDDQLLSGELELAHLANNTFAKRLDVVATIVETRLASPFDFTIKEFRETDTDKIKYAKDDKELSERWRQVLKLEALGRVSRMESRIESLEKAIAEEKKKKKPAKQSAEEAAAAKKKLDSLTKALAKIPTTPEKRLAKAQEDLEKSYSARFTRLKDVDPLTPAANFINAVTASFDPHTVYMPPAEKENFDIQMTGSLEGIGAVLVEEEHFIGVREVVPGGASWRQGELEAGDLILSVAQEGEEPVDIGDMKINKVVKMIRGPKGTTVTLTIEKDDSSIKTISIVRDRVVIEDSYARGAVLQRAGKAPVGYIYLPSFYGDTRHRRAQTRGSAQDVELLLGRLARQGVEGVIIDVRSNGGGLLDDSRKMTGLFIKEGPVVQTQLPDGTIEVLKDEDPSITFNGKVVVLIDRFSASASEILAAALQDYGRAVVVGPGPTHGKGTVQALLDLNRANLSPDDPPMGVLKLTIQQFFRINGSSTQRRGVTPDIAFPDTFKHLETGERNLDNSLPWSKVAELPFTPWVAKGWDKAALLQKSVARQAKSKYFVSLEKRALLLKKRQDDTLMPLRRKDYEAKLKAQKAEMDALVPDTDKAPNYFTVKEVKYGAQKPKVKRGGNHAPQDTAKAWSESLAKDAVVDESVRILGDMLQK